MTTFEWAVITLGITTGLLIPTLIFLIRGAIKWTRVEDRLTEIAKDLNEIVADKDKVHTEMLTQMREDRAATDRRLRWLEETRWKSN